MKHSIISTGLGAEISFSGQVSISDLLEVNELLYLDWLGAVRA
jgi:hypothetical protein